MVYHAIVDGGAGVKSHRLEIENSAGGWECRFDRQIIPIDAVMPQRDVLSLLIDGHTYEIKRERIGAELYIWVGNTRIAVELRDPRSLRTRQKSAGDEKGPKKILAPMPGRIVRLLVAENAEVEAGQGVIVVEAMKMQNEIRSPKKGIVKRILVTAGEAVNPGDILVVVE
jgi:biotin carboxyl carrier protein